MEKTKGLLCLLGLLALLSSPGAEAQEASSWTLTTALHATPGLFYNRRWDPLYNGNALVIALTRDSSSLEWGFGAEMGFSYAGWHLLFPLKGGIELFHHGRLSVSAEGTLLPGLLLLRPAPHFLIAAELTGRLQWQITEGWDLSLYAGPRYTTSPGYSRYIAPLELIDLTLGIASGFRLGKASP